MKNTEPKTKISSKKVPIICFILCVVLGPFNSTLGGFFFLAAFISFLCYRMQDNIPETSTMVGYNLTDWNLPEDNNQTNSADLLHSSSVGASPYLAPDRLNIGLDGVGQPFSGSTKD